MQFAMRSAWIFIFISLCVLFLLCYRQCAQAAKAKWAEHFLMEYYGNEKWKYEKEIIIFLCVITITFHHFRLTNYVMYFSCLRLRLAIAVIVVVMLFVFPH